jgi:hydroxyacylglutathione hydrolase
MGLEDAFGDIILKARAGLGLSVDAVSKKVGISKLEVTQLEAYARKPSKKEVELFASFLQLNSGRLEEIAFEKYVPRPVPASLSGRVHTIIGHIGSYEAKGYLVTDLSTGNAAMIDTANNPDGMMETIRRNGWNLKCILLTHTHQDHIGGLDQILKGMNVPVYVSQEESGQLGKLWDSNKDRLVKEGEKIPLGKILFEVLEVPGHTTGGRGYLSAQSDPPFGFFGDSIFAGSLGRAYSPVSYPELLQSVKKKVLALPQETVLFPGHGPATTAGEERAHNPFFTL